MADSQPQSDVNYDDFLSLWPILTHDERIEAFGLLGRAEAEELFLNLSTTDQAELLHTFTLIEQRSWIRMLAPDDATDLLQVCEPDRRHELLQLLDDQTRREVIGLLAYAEDQAGGLMNPRFARLRPEMTVDESLFYLRKQARDYLETIFYIYVLDQSQVLLGVISLKELLRAQTNKTVQEIMEKELVTVHDTQDQEVLSRLFAEHNLIAIPVVDDDGHMKGIVTVDDIVDVVQEEATEDMQKLGGMEALDAPYLRIHFFELIKKRAGWLAVLFLGEMFTATAMSHFETEIARAVILALFVPLIISSGGNSGSQATSLIIRSLALGEVHLRDWWRVLTREALSGLVLGGILGSIGFVRIVTWHHIFGIYGVHYLLVATTVALTLVAVVIWGTLAGSMLPFFFRRIGFDPATASAPFVATLVDVSGLVIYFTMARLILNGTLL